MTMTTKSPTKAGAWREAVLERDGFRCAADIHDKRCDSRHLKAHHICFKSQIVRAAYWIVANGITLSEPCHAVAHAHHNANISRQRLDAAVDAVNAATSLDELKRPYFRFAREA
jgi:hypothetical protein